MQSVGTHITAKTFKEVVNTINLQPDFQWLTIENSSESYAYTYQDLTQRIVDYLQFYQKSQLQPADTVLIVLKESLDLFASFFAGILYGVLPAYYAYPSPKQSKEQFLASIDSLVRYNEVRLLIGFAEVVAILNSYETLTSIPNFKGCFDHQHITTSNISLEKFNLTDTKEFFLQFSSGTTGAKKGVKISMQALFNQIQAYDEVVKFDKESVIISWLPHYHDMGLIACMLMPFIKQIPIVMMSPFEWVKRPRMLFEAITVHKGTHIWLPNFALGHLVNSIPKSKFSGLDISSLKSVVSCSEPVLYDSVQNFIQHFSAIGLQKEVIANCYAMAENTFAMTSSIEGMLNYVDIDYKTFKTTHQIELVEDGFKITSSGRPLQNLQLQILAEDKTPLPDRHIGEVHIKSDCMLECYHNNPTVTKKAFHKNWFNTGDLGFIHEGELYITGRKKEIIIVGGENIYPQDIEQILNATPHFAPGRNVVFGIKDERIGTERIIILAEVNINNHSLVDTVALKSKIFNKLNISISEIHLLKKRSLKKSTAGKISRFLNKQEYLNGAFDEQIRPKKLVPTTTVSLQDLVLDAISGINKPTIHSSTPLFSSGIIDSFGFAYLVASIEKAYQIVIPDNYLNVNAFQTIQTIEQTLGKIKNSVTQKEDTKVYEERKASLERLLNRISGKSSLPFRERLINNFPFPQSPLFVWLLRKVGIQIGKNVTFLGKIHVKIRGKAENIIIEDNVRLGNNVDLRNREKGKIILRKNSYVDANVRLVAARSGKIELKEGAEIGGGTIINSGGQTTIGRYVMIAGNVNINASTHGTAKNAFIKEQAHEHGEIIIGDDAWIGAGASILMNTNIGEGAIISSNSLVSGKIPKFALCAGVPAKVIKYRS